MITALSARRRRTDRVARGVLAAGTVVALIPLVLVIYYLIRKGAGALSWGFFTTDPTGSFFGDPGGIKSAILGTIEIVGLATVIAVPFGVGVALYLAFGISGQIQHLAGMSSSEVGLPPLQLGSPSVASKMTLSFASLTVCK